jgi:hypothetical protein
LLLFPLRNVAASPAKAGDRHQQIEGKTRCWKNDMKQLSEAFSPEVMAELSRPAGRRHQRLPGAPAGMPAIHSFDPWWVARVKSNAHRVARDALKREGFEVWYPQGRLLTMMPHRFIGPKKRNRKQLVLREGVREPYGDYIFLRRLFGSFSVLRLFQVSGCYGICLTGEQPATIEDFEVEVLRLAEFDGTFDRCEANITAKQLSRADIRQTDAAKERAVSEPITHAILDTSRQTLLFVEAFGRITRVVAGIGDLPASEP